MYLFVLRRGGGGRRGRGRGRVPSRLVSAEPERGVGLVQTHEPVSS